MSSAESPSPPPLAEQASLRGWDRHARDEIVAFYIHNYRERENWRRNSDALDDFSKAHYLNDLVDYLAAQHSRLIPMVDGHRDLNEIINMVFNIFDRAYFNKTNHPQTCDLECFVEAERYFCKEKALDYLAFLAYQNRVAHGLVGDDKTDYYAAIKKYPDWKKRVEDQSAAECGCVF